ncbi:phosphate transport system regulatory protein phou [hydrocarbon metagenome]|uniref:Phosphate transport system regulatory protein phou n=1 Tax=hydrocarbon metagenome TaxID=938273 RepID=A0A0W8E8F7_9ZZZZ
MVNESMGHELQQLKEDLLKMGRLLEEQIARAVKALVDKDIDMAREVIEKDDIIDQMELDIEKNCLRLIALKQPMARDLRFIATALRIIVDIERMADHAEDISEVCIALYPQKYIKPLIDIPRMANIVSMMVERALQALIKEDIDMAMSIVPLEQEIDALYQQIFRELLSYMMQDPATIPQAASLLLVAGHLERIGDHATNIAEMVIYVVDGRRIDLNVIARQ